MMARVYGISCSKKHSVRNYLRDLNDLTRILFKNKHPSKFFKMFTRQAIKNATYLLWHYRLWSFKTRDTKLERFLHKRWFSVTRFEYVSEALVFWQLYTGERKTTINGNSDSPESGHCLNITSGLQTLIRYSLGIRVLFFISFESKLRFKCRSLLRSSRTRHLIARKYSHTR